MNHLQTLSLLLLWPLLSVGMYFAARRYLRDRPRPFSLRFVLFAYLTGTVGYTCGILGLNGAIFLGLGVELFDYLGLLLPLILIGTLFMHALRWQEKPELLMDEPSLRTLLYAICCQFIILSLSFLLLVMLPPAPVLSKALIALSGMVAVLGIGYMLQAALIRRQGYGR